MKMTVQLVVGEDDGHEETITDVVILEKTCQQLDQVGFTLAEAKTLLQTLNHELATVFRRWYPNFPVQQGEARAA
jgi:hypothetical protein